MESSFGGVRPGDLQVLSVLNYDSPWPRPRPHGGRRRGPACVEMGSRRARGRLPWPPPRAAVVAGFESTSDRRRYRSRRPWAPPPTPHPAARLRGAGLPSPAGRSRECPPTLFVDTYDVERAVRLAVDIAGPDLGGVRLVRGDLVGVARRRRCVRSTARRPEHSHHRHAAWTSTRSPPAHHTRQLVRRGRAPGDGLGSPHVLHGLNSSRGGRVGAVSRWPRLLGRHARGRIALRRRSAGLAAHELGISHEPTTTRRRPSPPGGLRHRRELARPARHRGCAAGRRRHASPSAELPRAARRLLRASP
ncbi:hypothetical protein QJS66_00410 [Kocuria rhizophila]|nr:hypothetical protein QJS66_00410 [Kocuria rhizophila]